MDDKPYLSVVVAARNDDHGGNLLRRLGIFVEALAGQAVRHHLSLELIVVEWNPPGDRPTLSQAMPWPDGRGPCHIRIIQVPAEVHQRYRHSDALPLFQMIAKNVGIRRARGEFILATNLDILFSDDLFRFLALRRLEPGRMYRIDRYDVDTEVPIHGGIERQLEYCRTHVLRLNAREGTFRLTSDGLRQLEDADVAVPGSGVYFGRGWFPPERHFGQVYRWSREDSEIVVQPPRAEVRCLVFDLEPRATPDSRPFTLEVTSTLSDDPARMRVDRRCSMRLAMPFDAGSRFTIRMRTPASSGTEGCDPRPLSFRVFRCHWSAGAASATPELELASGAGALPGWVGRRASDAWRSAAAGLALLRSSSRTGEPARIGLPFSPRLIERLQPRIEAGGISLALRPGAAATTPGPDDLHTNACGDFTLMARQHWLDLRAYAEFHLYSMNLDSLFCYAAHQAGAREQLLEDPLRIYHIEHGSGWTPDGQARLFSGLAEKGIPWLDNQQVLGWAAWMRRLNSTVIFNQDNWGLGGIELSDTSPEAAVAGSVHEFHER